jgi:hypothetical protein
MLVEDGTCEMQVNEGGREEIDVHVEAITANRQVGDRFWKTVNLLVKVAKQGQPFNGLWER